MGRESACLVHQAGDVEQRLGRNAADVQAHAAERLVAFDEDDALAQVRRAKGGRISARPGAEDQDIAVECARGGTPRNLCSVGASGLLASGWRPRRFGLSGWPRLLGRARRGSRFCRLERQDDGAFRYLVPNLHAHFRNGAGRGRRNVHRRLVRFERDDRLLLLDPVARLDEHRDDRDVLEITDVGNADFHHRSILRASPSSPARKVLKRAAPAPSTTR